MTVWFPALPPFRWSQPPADTRQGRKALLHEGLHARLPEPQNGVRVRSDNAQHGGGRPPDMPKGGLERHAGTARAVTSQARYGRTRASAGSFASASDSD